MQLDAIFAMMIGIFTAFSALMIWLMNRLEHRLHADMSAISNRLDAHMQHSIIRFDQINARMEEQTREYAKMHAEQSARMDQFNARIDKTNERIDFTQEIILRKLGLSTKTD